MAASVILLLLLSLMGLTLLRIFSKESAQGSGNIISREVRAANAVLDASDIEGLSLNSFLNHPAWKEDYLTPNAYSRPGDPLGQVKSIFVHYTANPGTSAAQNRSYFEQLKDTHITSASSHFIIGYEGEIIQCIPLDEIGYAVATRNEDSISIECCYIEADGSFTEETYQSLVTLLAWLTNSYGLTEDDILRHYDCGGKSCPLYYVEHETAWNNLKADVAAVMTAE
jgi:N-acetylmuramoyl-L-alanine amidase CwlA